MTARERALELLERQITGGRDVGADPAVTARECLVALEGLGYRPTEARPAVDWRVRGGGADGREAAAKARELYPNLRHATPDPYEAA